MTAPADLRRIIRCGVVESTQPIAFDLAERGAPDGTAVVADAQTRGRGRRGRAWHAAPGTSLLVSVLLRPRLDPARLPLLSFAAALAVAGTLERLADLTPRVKWPNDVLVGGRKIAGILLESRPSESGTVVVAGIGLNLTQDSFPDPVGRTATSVWLETSRRVDRETTLTVLLAELDAWRMRLEDEGFAPLRERWLTLADTIGRDVTAGDVTGVAVDLASDGALVVDDGTSLRRVIAGDIMEHGERAAGAPAIGAGGGSRDAAGR